LVNEIMPGSGAVSVPVERLHPPFDGPEELDHAQGEAGLVIFGLGFEVCPERPLGVGKFALLQQRLERSANDLILGAGERRGDGRQQERREATPVPEETTHGYGPAA
jgi:hypothetical protein